MSVSRPILCGMMTHLCHLMQVEASFCDLCILALYVVQPSSFI